MVLEAVGLAVEVAEGSGSLDSGRSKRIGAGDLEVFGDSYKHFFGLMHLLVHEGRHYFLF